MSRNDLSKYIGNTRIVSICPAQGWWLVYIDQSNEQIFKRPIMAFAAVEKQADDDSDRIDSSVEVLNYDGFLFTEEPSSSNFLGFFYEKEDWGQARREFLIDWRSANKKVEPKEKES